MNNRFKCVVLIALCFISKISCCQEKHKVQLTIETKDSALKGNVLIIEGLNPYRNLDEMTIIDSFYLDNYKKVIIKESQPKIYSILFRSINHALSFIGRPGEIFSLNVQMDEDSLLKWDSKKSKENSIYIENIIRKGAPLIEKVKNYYDSINIAKAQNDEKQLSIYRAKNNYYYDSLQNIYKSVIYQYPKSFVALYFLKVYQKDFNEKFIKKYVASLPKDLKESAYSKSIIYEKVEMPKLLHKIKNFSDFVFRDSAERLHQVRLGNSKVYLIDFWATWCKPCLANFPNLDTIFKKYDSSQLKIISISFDDKIDVWKKDFNKRKLPWLSLFDSMNFKSIASKYYDIKSIPRYILLDKNGEVLVDKLKIEEMESIIKSNLK